MIVFKLEVFCGDMNRRELITLLRNAIEVLDVPRQAKGKITDDAGTVIGNWSTTQTDSKPQTIERDEYARVWTMNERKARLFFGAPDDAEVVVLKEEPETAEERAKYLSTAKLFGVKFERKSHEVCATPGVRKG